MTDERDDAGAVHQIGEAAEAVGLSLRTIRHYEEVGLVPPSGRSAGGFRLYTDADIERLLLVKHMKPLEFTLEEMRDLLQTRDRLAAGADAGGADAGGADAPGDDDLRGRLAQYAATAEERCERLRSRLAQAEQLAEQLRAEAGDPSTRDQ